MRIAVLAKKFISPVAVLVSALLALTGVVPANAAAPAAANSLGTTQVSTNWTIGSGSTVNLANASGIDWVASYEARTTAWAGKTLSLAGSITPALANASANVSASLNYYKADGSFSATYNYGNINGGTNQGGDYQALVPADTGRVTIQIRASFGSQTMDGSVAPVQGTTYTPTFTLKVDGVAQTLVNTWTGSNTVATNHSAL